MRGKFEGGVEMNRWYNKNVIETEWQFRLLARFIGFMFVLGIFMFLFGVLNN